MLFDTSLLGRRAGSPLAANLLAPASGKTHLAITRGHLAVEHRRSVLFAIIATPALPPPGSVHFPRAGSDTQLADKLASLRRAQAARDEELGRLSQGGTNAAAPSSRRSTRRLVLPKCQVPDEPGLFLL